MQERVDKYRYLVWIMLPEEIAEKINSLRTKSQPQAVRNGNPPHITVHKAFILTKPDACLEKIKELLYSYQNLRLRTLGPKIFPGLTGYLYLQVAPNLRLNKLNREISRVVGVSVPNPYKPHVTIAKLPRKNIRATQRYLANFETQFSFTAQGPFLLRLNGSGPEII